LNLDWFYLAAHPLLEVVPGGWDYTHTEDVTLVAGRYLTVTFRAETGGFNFR
jgi:hypothetical protein